MIKNTRVAGAHNNALNDSKVNVNEHRFNERLIRAETVYIEVRPETVQSSSKVIECHSLDISRVGLCVGMSDELSAGTVLDLCVLVDEQRYFLKAEVKWQRPELDQLDTGLELFDALDTDIDLWIQRFDIEFAE